MQLEINVRKCRNLLVLALAWLTQYSLSAQTFSNVTYAEDATNFTNPERGFYRHTEVHSGNYSLLSESTLNTYRANGYTLIIRVFYLEEFLNDPISTAYLDNVERDFATARKTGFKIIVRFAYTLKSSPPYGDATPARVLQHIEQLKPLLRQNGDVIAVLQAGFIGAWGEWYYTDHFSTQLGNPNEADWANRRAVVNALLDALPPDRMIQVRTPQIKRMLIESTPAIAIGEAFTGTPKARIGHHNDCFLASPDDYGTYINITEEKAYLEEETKYLPMGGETCGPYVPLSECPNALAEMERFHWSYLNMDYHPAVIEGWNTNGCLDQVEKQLGYRCRLTKSRWQQESKPGGAVTFEVALVNDGWANVFNPRSVELVLKNNLSGSEFKLAIEQDPRLWPLADTIKISGTAGLPANMEEGDYAVYLNLPDPELAVRNNPMYSIRVANTGTWDTSSGYNSLNQTVQVSATAAVPDYSGADFFLSGNDSAPTLSAPSPLRQTTYGNNVILFWGLTGSDFSRVIQRSDNNGPFNTIAALSPDTFVFVDHGLTASANYTYRSYVTDGISISPFTPDLSLNTEGAQPPFYLHNVDGQIEEWDAIRPLSAIETASGTHSFKLFADKDSLHVLISGGAYQSWQVLLNTDDNVTTGITQVAWNDHTADYMIRNDSLYEANAGTWKFIRKCLMKASGTELELAINTASLANLQANLLVRAAVKLPTQQGAAVLLPLPGREAVLFVRALTPPPPVSFLVSPSPTLPESQLIVSWQSCAACLGYQLERSVSSGGFSVITSLPRTSFVFYDDGLTTGAVYNYRVANYNETGLSDYSPTLTGTPQAVTGLESEFIRTNIFPNPVHEFLFVQSQTEKPIRVSACNAQGIAVELGTPERSNQGARFDVRHLTAGLYFLKVQTGNGCKTIKFLKN